MTNSIAAVLALGRWIPDYMAMDEVRTMDQVVDESLGKAIDSSTSAVCGIRGAVALVLGGGSGFYGRDVVRGWRSERKENRALRMALGGERERCALNCAARRV